jgi:trigger factor
MQYELQVETVSPIRRRLHFTLQQGEVKGELDRAFKDLKRRVRLPGFRPGKVPRQLLEARFGGQVKGEVSGKLIDRAWREALADLDVAGQPALEDQGDLSGREVFTFTIGVDVKPELELDGYKGLEVSYAAREVTDADIDGRVQAKLASKARLVEVTDGRGVAAGDLVLTAITLDKDGESLADEPGTMVSAAGDRYYPGIESLLMGLSVDGSASGEVTIAESSAYEHLQGQTVQAKVTVQAIQANQVPELDDDLASELGYEGGAAGMRTAIRMEVDSAVQEEGRI